MRFPILRSRLARLARDRRGAIAVTMALTAVLLIGFVGLGVDIGQWETAKRDMQGAADHAAYSAAIAAGTVTCAQITSNGGKWQENAAGVAAQMGYPVNSAKTTTNGTTSCKGLTPVSACWSNSQTGVKICANNPPAAPDQFSTAQLDIQVTVSQPQPTWFSHLFLSSVTASASAVVQPTLASGQFCIIALDPTATGAFSVSGNTSVSTPGCEIQDNSGNNSKAAVCSGAATIQTDVLNVVGTPSGCTSSNVVGAINYPAPVVLDPYAPSGTTPLAPVMPTASQIAAHNCDGNSAPGVTSGSIKGIADLIPTIIGGGPQMMVFCGGLTIQAGAVVTMEPGIYVFDQGSFNINGGTVDSPVGDVHVFLTSTTGSNWATITISGNTVVQLSAAPALCTLTPTESCTASGGASVVPSPLTGIVVYEDAGAPNSVQTSSKLNGGAAQSLIGVVYFPSTAVNYAGGNAASPCTILAADTISLTGNSNFTESNCTGVSAFFAAKPQLVE